MQFVSTYGCTSHASIILIFSYPICTYACFVFVLGLNVEIALSMLQRARGRHEIAVAMASKNGHQGVRG